MFIKHDFENLCRDLCCSCSSCCFWSSVGRRWWLSCAHWGSPEQRRYFLCSHCCLSACSHTHCCLHCGKTKPSSPLPEGAHHSTHCCWRHYEITVRDEAKYRKNTCFILWDLSFKFLRALKLVPVVTSMAATAAVWFSGSCNLAVGRRQCLYHCCPLLSQAISPTASCSTSSSTSSSTENKEIGSSK